jgi:hypothetical protein
MTMAEKNKAKSFIKKKFKPGAIIGFNSPSTFRGRVNSPGKRTIFNPASFKTQHKG